MYNTHCIKTLLFLYIFLYHNVLRTYSYFCLYLILNCCKNLTTTIFNILNIVNIDSVIDKFKNVITVERKLAL